MQEYDLFYNMVIQLVIAMSDSPEVCQFSSTEAMHIYIATTYLHQIDYKIFL